MSQALHIIADVSGSMNEMGKIHLQRNLCRYATQLDYVSPERYAGVKIHIYQWAQKISEIKLEKNGDLPVLSATDVACLKELSVCISDNLSDSKETRILILSDGNFSSSDILDLKSQFDNTSGVIIRTVAVGADANQLSLKKLSTNNTVHLAENISSAIDSALFSMDDPLISPASTAEIVLSKPIESEESVEDWDA